MPNPLGPLGLAEDQIADTFATAGTSDPSWSEKREPWWRSELKSRSLALHGQVHKPHGLDGHTGLCGGEGAGQSSPDLGSPSESTLTIPNERRRWAKRIIFSQSGGDDLTMHRARLHEMLDGSYWSGNTL
jgi:hypothetical protein